MTAIYNGIPAGSWTRPLKNGLLPLLACWILVLGPGSSLAQPQYIHANVSVKLIVNPTTGTVPSLFSSNRMDQWFGIANTWLARNYRGYRLRVVDPYLFIGRANDPTGPSRWYSVDMKYNASNRWAFEAEAKVDSRYQWNTNAINLYVNNAGWSVSSFSQDGKEVVVTGYGLVASSRWIPYPHRVAGNLLHEIGHYFELFHTFDGENTTNCIPGNDGLSDTLPDSNCWSNLNQVAIYHFEFPYESLPNPADQVLVNNCMFNLMSYHLQTNLLTQAEYDRKMNVMTEQQCDKWTEFGNLSRWRTLSGLTRYVDPGGSVFWSGLTRERPLPFVINAIQEANPGGGDILLLTPGTYNERLTIDKPLTLRATRDGWVTIGR